MSNKKKGGRPLKYGEKTVTIRVPARLVDQIMAFIAKAIKL